jgi:2-polyprenyl-6-methoxyphenol hydroxylase-like FAD-dependent oxidoreductase
MKSQNLQAIVVGGGIVGPALALLLKKAGMSSTVYEAHPRLQDVGGGSVALEDALYLVKLLGQFSGEFEPVFVEFERGRRPRAERISAWAHKNEVRQKGELGPFGCWLRDRMLSVALPLFGARSLDWMYSYRVDWNEPIRGQNDRTGSLMPGATAA